MPSLDTSYRRFSLPAPASKAPEVQEAEAPALPAPRPSTRRIDFLSDFLASLRLQERPRISSWAILCYVARHPDGVWQRDLDDALNGLMGTQCEFMARDGLLTLENRRRTTRKKVRFVQLTDAGWNVIFHLLNPQQGKGLIP